MRDTYPVRLLVLAVAGLLLTYNTCKAQFTYYSKSTGDLNIPSTWGTNPDGTGLSPLGFFLPASTFIITNAAVATIGANWTVNGLGSKVQVGNGTMPVEFIIPAGFVANCTMDVMNNGTVTVLHTTSPTYGNLNTGSTVQYSRSGNQTIPNAAYYNLLLNGSGLKSTANTANTSISNSLVIDPSVTYRFPTSNLVTTTLSGSISGGGAIAGSGNSNVVITGTGPFGTMTFTTTLSLRSLNINRVAGEVTLGSNLTVSTDFSISKGALNLNNNLLSLNGEIIFPTTAADGFLIGSASSSLTIGTSTTLVSNPIWMDPSTATSGSLSRFSINRAGQTLMLGNNLTVIDNFVQTNGIIDINGNALSIGGIISFPSNLTNGYFIGSATSSLAINGNGTTGNTLKFDQVTAGGNELNSFIIDRTGSTLIFGSSVKCNSNFIHNNGPVTLGSNLLELNGAITFPASAANGSMTGSTSSSLSIAGSGSITNPLLMNNSGNSSRTLSHFHLNRAVATLSLGNALISQRFEQINGNIDLNGVILTLNGEIVFPASSSNGVFIGSPTSSLAIGTSTAAIYNPLNFDQSVASARTLSQLTLNRVADTLTLGAPLIVENAFVHTAGAIDINGQMLTANGNINFPTTFANGFLIGSSTSSLTLAGNGTIGSTLKFDDTNAPGRMLDAFTIDRTGSVLTFGSSITCGSLFVHNNGAVALGTNELSLNGAIVFPAAATNGSFTGSTTSSLSIAGSGSITNPLFMSQAGTAARTLSSFLLNRVGADLVLGDALIASRFEQVNGTVNLNGALLTLNGEIIFPASLSNGVFIGSPSSSLVISASGSPISNALNFSQNSASDRSLSQLTLSRVADTLNLGTSLTVADVLVQTAGKIDFSGQSLSVNGNLTFPSSLANGYFIGSSAASLTIGGNGTISNSLKFDPTNASGSMLDVFIIDRSGSALTFGSSITCGSLFTFSNGAVSIGANELSLNGTIVFPAAATNGSFTGSTTSSLSIAGTGSIANPIYMNQSTAATRTWGRFAFDRAAATLTLGDALTANVFEHTNGLIALNGTSLTLNSIITFPASSANGVFIGSHTSSLTISGSGAITNSLKLDQSNAANYSLSDLRMARAGQALDIGSPLEIRNALTPASGSVITNNLITLKADASRSAMVGVVGGVVSGNLHVETFMPGGFTGWTNLGPSGITGLTVANWEGQIPMTCVGCPHNEYSTGGYFVSIQSYSETLSGNAAYLPLSYTSALTPGRGYWVYVGTSNYTTAAINYSVTGPVRSGNVSVPVTNSANSGFNLVANPYPAPIDWNLVTGDASNSNIDGSVYFYNPDLGVTISFVDGVSNPPGYIQDGIIPMGQGFYIQANANTNLLFRESHKSNQNTSANPVLRKAHSSDGQLLFRLVMEGHEEAYDETTIRFHQDATSGYDRKLDAKKLFETPGYRGTGAVFSKYSTICTRDDSTDYSINSLKFETGKSYEIPVLARAHGTGKFSIRASNISGWPAGTCAGLYDKLLNTTHDLNAGAYNFTLADSTSQPRFVLSLCVPGLATNAKELADADNTYHIFGETGPSVNIEIPADGKHHGTVSIFNLTGQKIVHDVDFHDTDRRVKIDMSGQAEQVVVVKVADESGSISKKVLIAVRN